MTSRLVETFERWGYAEVGTPAVEYFDVIAEGLSDQGRERCVRFIEPGTGELVMLRADVTPQIARMVSQRHDVDLPDDRAVRLCYASVVVRQPDGPRDRIEQHQAGVEFVGDGAPGADAEIVALCHGALASLGLTEVTLDLADVGVTRNLLEATGLPEDQRDGLRQLIARKDAAGVRSLAERYGVEDGLARTLMAVCHLYGPPSILDRAQDVLGGTVAAPRVERLRAVSDALRADCPEACERLVFDLGEARGFDYYTGLRIRAWAPGTSAPLVRGGRYDDLLGRYGESRPATGFAIDLDGLEAALQAAGLESTHGPKTPAVLVVVAQEDAGARTQASGEARKYREAGLRAWVQAGLDRDAGLRAADDAGASALVLVGAGGAVETLRRDGSGWTAGPLEPAELLKDMPNQTGDKQ